MRSQARGDETGDWLLSKNELIPKRRLSSTVRKQNKGLVQRSEGKLKISLWQIQKPTRMRYRLWQERMRSSRARLD